MRYLLVMSFMVVSLGVEAMASTQVYSGRDEDASQRILDRLNAMDSKDRADRRAYCIGNYSDPNHPGEGRNVSVHDTVIQIRGANDSKTIPDPEDFEGENNRRVGYGAAPLPAPVVWEAEGELSDNGWYSINKSPDKPELLDYEALCDSGSLKWRKKGTTAVVNVWYSSEVGVC